MEFTPWVLLQDAGIISMLILVGQFLRAKVKLVQKLLLPAPLIAGLLGLILGPNVLGILPLSNKLGTYASVLIVLVFAAMPIGQKTSKDSIANRNVGGMFFSVTGMILLQYGFFILLSLYVLVPLFDVHPGFGVMLPTGFCHGHGTASAIGSTFAKLGWADAQDLGMTSATFGIVGGILFGIAIINFGARKGLTNYVKDPKNLSSDLRTGLIPKEEQKAGGKITISGICLDSLTFHLALILIASAGGYVTCVLAEKAIPNIGLPEFCIAMIYGFIIQIILTKTKTDVYVDRPTINRISGASTDLLVVCGVASVKISAIMTYFVPLMIMFSLAYVLVIAWVFIVGPRCSDHDWLERAMIAFGQSTGVLATGILLLRVVDPDLKSKGLEDSGTTNLLNRPIIIALQALVPYFVAQSGMTPYLTGWVCIGAFLLLLVISIKFKWLHSPVKN